MATVTRTKVVDDLDGSDGAKTIRFSIARAQYEIDLTPENVDGLYEALAPFITKSRRVPARLVQARADQSAVEAMGLHLQLTDARPQQKESGAEEAVNTETPENVRVGDYPLLSAAAWQLEADSRLGGFEALRTYERNWRHLDHAAMGDKEKALIQALADKYSKGVLLV